MEIFIKFLTRICFPLPVFIIACILGYIFLPDSIVFYSEQKQGESIITEIENFRLQQKRLPSDEEFRFILKKIVSHDIYESCPCYNQHDDNNYYIWYQGKSLGESFRYNSKTREWSRGG